MNNYYIIKWDKEVKGHWEILADNTKELYDVLSRMFPEEEISLHGFNFKYTSNAMHFLAAGYPILNFVYNYDHLRGPAHFNPAFYDIVGYTQQNINQ